MRRVGWQSVPAITRVPARGSRARYAKETSGFGRLWWKRHGPRRARKGPTYRRFTLAWSGAKANSARWWPWPTPSWSRLIKCCATAKPITNSVRITSIAPRLNKRPNATSNASSGSAMTWQFRPSGHHKLREPCNLTGIARPKRIFREAARASKRSRRGFFHNPASKPSRHHGARLRRVVPGQHFQLAPQRGPLQDVKKRLHGRQLRRRPAHHQVIALTVQGHEAE